MSKTKILLGGALTSFTAIASVGNAEAEVVRTTEKGASGEIIKEGNNLQEDINTINKLINNISRNYKNVEVAKTDLVITETNKEDVKRQLVELQKKLNELEKQDVKFKSLDSNAKKFNIGYNERDNDVINVDLTNLKDVSNKLNNIIEQRKDIIESNDNVISEHAVSNSSATFSKNYNDAIANANKELANLTSLDDHYVDGVLKNVKALNEKAETVSKDSGLKVNTSKTKLDNVITKTTKNIDNSVESLVDIESKKAEVLKQVNEIRKLNEAEVVKSKTYTDNAVKNMELINTWLKGASNQTNKVKEDVEKNSKASTLINEYKEKQKAELIKLKDKVSKSDKPEKVKTKMLEDIDKAIATIDESGVKVNVVGKIDAIGNLDFGDIGRETSEIQKLMDNASSQINASVGSSLDNLKTKNAESLAKVEPVIQNNIERIKKYIEGIDKGGTSTQIDEAWLNTRPIYSEDTSGKYKKYVEDALKQTAESTEGVFTGSQELGPNMTLKYAKEGKTIANIAAAQWIADSEKGLKGAFGSVMVPSKNINDFVTVRGRKVANSQKFKGGAQGILDYIGARAWVSGTQRHNIYREAVFSDIRNQHINYVGNENVFLVASYQDHITFDFKDSYVTYDENGKPKTYPLSLTMHAMPFHGSKFPNDLPGNSRLMFLYYLSVDPKTGKVLTGVGYYRHILQGNGTNGGGGSTGENGNALRLGTNGGLAGEYNDTETLASHKYFSPIAYLNPNANPYKRVGLWTTFEVRVDEGAGEGTKRSPLYISDIDDNQIMYVYKDTYGTNTDIILSGSDAPKIRDGGDYMALDSNVPQINGLASGANLDENSVMITGQSTVGIGHGGSYQSIDVSLFNPWGIIGGSPSLSLEKVNANVDTIEVNTPNVKAHTEGNYNLQDVKAEIIGVPRDAQGLLDKLNYKILLPNVANEKENLKRVSSNTSFIVKKLKDVTKLSASGNTLVVKGVDGVKSSSGNTLVVKQLDGIKSSSANSLIVKTITTNSKSSSGNTLIVKTTQPIEKISASNNSLITRIVDNELKIKDKVVNIKVYADETLKSEVDKALNDWKLAFKKHNIIFNYSYTSLKDNVDIAFLDSDNQTTRVDKGWLSVDTDDDYGFEMTELAGLMTKTSTVDLVDADSNDKYSRSGIKSKDVLNKANYIVQLNTDAIRSQISKEKVLKHEIGHIFGLQHDNNDSLMTTYYNDPIFSGDISIKDASLAVQHINDGKFCTCSACAKLK
jgi:hypothetical protein